MSSIETGDLRVEEEVVEQASELHPDELYASKAEPWADWESRMVFFSIGLGVAGLVVLVTLINIFLL
ncbi:MAG TPA: hypothetical protein ENJ62_05020 [Bryobacterales bacterium]|nr:hypothetical protein [Bryobacterales bacterium]